jgi:hypothetical protein
MEFSTQATYTNRDRLLGGCLIFGADIPHSSNLEILGRSRYFFRVALQLSSLG